jgi:PAS domain S-box-containing protein
MLRRNNRFISSATAGAPVRQLDNAPMQPAHESASTLSPSWAKRLFGRWWRRQSPARQDRFATLGPLVSVLLFLLAIVAAFWTLRNEEIERATDAVRRDTEMAQQQIRQRLSEDQELMVRLTRDIVTRDVDTESFFTQTAGFAPARPELTQVIWLNADRTPRATFLGSIFRGAASLRNSSEDPSLPRQGADTASEAAFLAARTTHVPTFSRPFVDVDGTAVFQVQIPLISHTSFTGTLVAEYSIESLLRHAVPEEVTKRRAIEVLDANEDLLASTITSMPGRPSAVPSIAFEAPLAPASNGLILRGLGYRTSIGLISNSLFWMVLALSGLTVWMLLGTWRHVRRRAQIQGALVHETNFRRAMENSMLTGMRAMDMEGRITYVNPAFCAMTGFADHELVGRLPPFPHWPHDRIEENARLLQQELQGRSPAGGIEVKIMRRDQSVFDARMYVSPLIDAKGVQTGWMTSITNITEAKRVRDQLSASHERFTTVLEGLDAAVSVLSVQQGQLLFANRSYRLWFGSDAHIHAVLAGGIDAEVTPPPDTEDGVDDYGGLPQQELTEAGTSPREVFVESLDKWFDVRARYLQWTDGRLAQMLIATDITARLRAEQLAQQQADRAHFTARLIAVGEMASSVAHELNQPLTAISNYCSGMVSRVRNESISQEDLVSALQKTAKQAERAGHIIHRIRNFVKRREPQRQVAQAREMVDDAVELASIELRRRNVAIQVYVAQRLPPLLVDPILIEQVLLNLLKNAAEAIDGAQLPLLRRHIELRVVPRYTPDEGGVIEFSVNDKGPGLKEDALNRLYEAFFSTKVEGMGIGLSLCRSIIESHRGRIRAQNLYNGGTVAGCSFSFTLPVETSHRVDSASAIAAFESSVDPDTNATDS